MRRCDGRGRAIAHFLFLHACGEANYVGNGLSMGPFRNGQLRTAVPVLQGLAVVLIRVRLCTCMMFGFGWFQYGLPSTSLGSGTEEEQR
jgi:hypothetical protein